jgi:hypothetical protein
MMDIIVIVRLVFIAFSFLMIGEETGRYRSRF